MDQKNKLFVGNLSYDFTEQTLLDTLEQVFSEVGTVVEIKVPTFRDSGKIKGIAFVTMGSEEEASMALEKLEGYEFGPEGYNTRPLHLDLAKPMVPRSDSYGSNNGGGYNGGRSNNNNRSDWSRSR